MSTILSETLSGDWVITREHPEDPDAEVELARFNVSATEANTDARLRMLFTIPQCAASLDKYREGIRVQSHDVQNRRFMQNALIDLKAVVAA